MFSCGCCLETYPKLHKHTHHKIPRALGGNDSIGNLIDLCPGCHDAVHMMAYKLSNPKYSDSRVRDTAISIYKDNDIAIKTSLELAYKVRDEIIFNREKAKDPNSLVSVSCSLRKEHKDLIAIIAKERKISQEFFIRNAIFCEIGRIFNKKIDSIEENRIISSLKHRNPNT